MLRKSINERLKPDEQTYNIINQERFLDLNFVDYMNAVDMEESITVAKSLMYRKTNYEFESLSIRDVFAQISRILEYSPDNVSAKRLVLDIMVRSLFAFIRVEEPCYHEIVVDQLYNLGVLSRKEEELEEAETERFFCEESGENWKGFQWYSEDCPFDPGDDE